MNKTRLIAALKDQLAIAQLSNVFRALLVVCGKLTSDDGIELNRKALALSAAYHRLEEQVESGEMDNRDERTERARIVNALVRMIEEFTELHEESPLSLLQAAAEILSTPRPEKPYAYRERGLSEMHQFTCDRKPQNLEFRIQYQDHESRSCHFFGIHGDKNQSHRGLVTRFFLQYLEGPSDGVAKLGKKVLLNESHVLEDYKTELKFKLFEAFGLQHQYLSPDALNLKQLIGQLQERHYNQLTCLAVEFRIRSTYWKPFTRELIAWFTEQFCNPKSQPKPMPRCYFFLSIMYETDQKPAAKSLFSVFKKKKKILPDSNTRLRQAIRELPNCQLLSELQPVPYADLEDWIELNLTDNELEKARVLQQFFPEEREHYDMAEVELRLRNIIAQHNDKAT